MSERYCMIVVCHIRCKHKLVPILVVIVVVKCDNPPPPSLPSSALLIAWSDKNTKGASSSEEGMKSVIMLTHLTSPQLTSN